MNKRTKKYKRLTIIFRLLSFVITIVPLITYTIIGLCNGETTVSRKVALGFCLVMAIILVLLNVILKYHLRSPFFIMLLGIYVCLNKILPLLIIISCGIILDEFILQPCIKRFAQKYTINKEMDIRGEQI